MTTIVVAIRRKPGISREEFTAYWRDVHAPKIKACASFARHIRSYVQFHASAAETPIARLFGVSGDYDGVAMLTFESEEAMAEAFAEPAYMRDIRPDEFNFVDTDNCLTILTAASPVI